MFVDETGASTKMSRLRGRAKWGQRCRAPVPHGHWKTTTLVGALRLGGMTAPMVLDGPMNGPAFLAYVRRVLAPTLRRGETVVMDNLPAHRVLGVRTAIEAAGASLRLLPPYSPDLNPVRGTAPDGRLRQTQSPAAQGRGPHHPGPLGRHPRRLAPIHRWQMRQLLRGGRV